MEINSGLSAVEKISTALNKIWANDIIRNLCFDKLETATSRSKKKS